MKVSIPQRILHFFVPRSEVKAHCKLKLSVKVEASMQMIEGKKIAAFNLRHKTALKAEVERSRVSVTYQ